MEELYTDHSTPDHCDVFSLEELYAEDLNKELIPETSQFVDFTANSQSSVSSEVSQSSSSASVYLPSSPDVKRQYVPYKYKREAVEYWRSGKKKALNWETVKKKYWKLKSRKMLYRWLEQVEEVGTRLDKLKFVYEATFSDFKNARKQKLPFHDSELKRCALIHARAANLQHFTASKFFLWKFKKHYRIASRKITSFVTKATTSNTEKILKETEEFRAGVNEIIDEKGPENVANTDQTGCNLEIRTGRTHDHVGAKRVEAIAQSISAITHSYTLQLTVTAAGKLLPLALLVLQEKNGKLSDRVKLTLPKGCDNIVVAASTSGKCTKQHVRLYHKEIYSKCMPTDSVLIEDAWAGHIDISVAEDALPEDYNVDIRILPKGSTSIAQPLDVFFFRQLKEFLRKVIELALLIGTDVKFFQRNEIIILQSLTLHQMCSPRFADMIRYAWFKSGYSTPRPESFVTPKAYCFDFKGEKCSSCNEYMFMRCAWCTRPLCFKHFYTEQHRCEEYVE
ncbi:hypothetical protein B566_EDAN018069 [Ephemera danica]|nr:hypothetical protein B566_EDAN018069 [Ephemera danica]